MSSSNGDNYKLDNENSEIQIYKHGATLTSWKLHGNEIIFCSGNAKLDGSKPIRGGVPICFPAFGPWPLGPQHGFARNSKWTQLGGSNQDGCIKTELGLKSNDETKKMWDSDFNCIYSIESKGNKLKLEMNVENTGKDKEFDFTFCFHCYFSVPDVELCKISGLKGLTYADKTLEGTPKNVEDRDEVTVTQFTDRVYEKAPDSGVILSGLHGGKSLKVTKSNLADIVVWNPWKENAAKMGDFGDTEYPTMICVEPANASSKIALQAGEKWTGIIELEVFQ